MRVILCHTCNINNRVVFVLTLMQHEHEFNTLAVPLIHYSTQKLSTTKLSHLFLRLLTQNVFVEEEIKKLRSKSNRVFID